MCNNIKCSYCNNNRINKDSIVNENIYVEIVKELLKMNLIKELNILKIYWKYVIK